MCDLENWPQHLMLLLSLMACVLSVFELVLELEESVFDVVKAVRWRFAILGCANSWHLGSLLELMFNSRHEMKVRNSPEIFYVAYVRLH